MHDSRRDYAMKVAGGVLGLVGYTRTVLREKIAERSGTHRPSGRGTAKDLTVAAARPERF
jgi:hypothetical protein